jgi:large subunit ribosomal protein L1
MQKKDVSAALKAMREQTKQRKFTQSVELIVNFKDLDTKKPINQVDVKVNLPFATGKKGGGKSLLFARDKAFIEAVKGTFDRIIEESEIPKLNKKDIGLIVAEFDSILAEGPVMISVGKYLGQQLAPKGKMPKPVQPTAEMAGQMLKQMGSVTRVTNKKGKFMPLVQAVIGSEKMPDEQLAENATAIVDAVVKALPRQNQNLKSVYIKESMGPCVKVVAHSEAEHK